MRNAIAKLEKSSNAIDKTTQDLAWMVDGLQDSGGLLHYFSNDTNAVEQLQRTLHNIEQGTARFNENMEALKQNFLFRGYFKKQEKGQLKVERGNKE